jgi:hypothetical protein
MEDLTNPEAIRTNVKCDRKVSLYGYLRGAYLKNNSQIHMPGIVCSKALDVCHPLVTLSKAEPYSGIFKDNPAMHHLPSAD